MFGFESRYYKMTKGVDRGYGLPPPFRCNIIEMKGNNMKIKEDFITNSSSTSYIIFAHSNVTAKEFINYLFMDEDFVNEFVSYDFGYTKEELLESLERDSRFPLKKGRHEIAFGDEDGSAHGEVFDYCLRDGFVNKKFKIMYDRALR